MIVFALWMALQTPSPDIDKLNDAAKTAVAKKDWCAALAAFEALVVKQPSEAKWLYNAAEVAYAYDDRVQALALYRELQTKFPGFERAAKVQQRIVELGQSIATGSLGQTCVVAPVCGNGKLEAGEECDDGNSKDGDACSATCKKPSCGNGVVEAGEQCDDGNTKDGDGCTSICKLPACGDGHLDPGEQCDDANTNDGDGCDHVCAKEIAKPVVVEKPVAPKSSASSTPWIVAGAGAVVAVAGVVVGGIGLAPAIAFSTDSQRQADAQHQFVTGDAAQKTDALATATEVYPKLQTERDNWNGYGIPMTWAGAGAAAVGVVVTAVGLLWGKASLDDEAQP